MTQPADYGLARFTVVADFNAIITDSSKDPGKEPDREPMTGLVTFKARLPVGQPLQVAGFQPRPSFVALAPVEGRIDNDGQLCQYDGTVGIRLIAWTPALGLDKPLVYDVYFERVHYNKSVQIIKPFAFEAPSDDKVVNLCEAQLLPSGGV